MINMHLPALRSIKNDSSLLATTVAGHFLASIAFIRHFSSPIIFANGRFFIVNNDLQLNSSL